MSGGYLIESHFQKSINLLGIENDERRSNFYKWNGKRRLNFARDEGYQLLRYAQSY